MQSKSLAARAAVTSLLQTSCDHTEKLLDLLNFYAAKYICSTHGNRLQEAIAMRTANIYIQENDNTMTNVFFLSGPQVTRGQM